MFAEMIRVGTGATSPDLTQSRPGIKGTLDLFCDTQRCCSWRCSAQPLPCVSLGNLNVLEPCLIQETLPVTCPFSQSQPDRFTILITLTTFELVA